MHLFGKLMGTEQRLKGSNVMLGPGVCLARVPTNGRNFEYFAEDPVLAREMAYQVTLGIQSEKVIACAKHYVDNNQEGPGHNGRLIMDARVDARTQAEMYLPPFEGAIEAGVGSIMCSYNLINGTYACENEALGVLKEVGGSPIVRSLRRVEGEGGCWSKRPRSHVSPLV
jgi:beta-glucosidase